MLEAFILHPIIIFATHISLKLYGAVFVKVAVKRPPVTICGDGGDALRGAAPIALRQGIRFSCAAGFPTHSTVRPSFLATQGGGLPGGHGGRSITLRTDRGGAGLVPRAGCHPCLRWRGPEDTMDRRLPASAVSWRRCGSSSALQGGARPGPLGPFWWRREPSAAPFVDCGAPFVESRR